MIILVRFFVAVSLITGAWRSYQEMGAPIWFEGRRYWRCRDGLFRRWYGGRGRTADELGDPAATGGSRVEPR